MSEQTAIPLFPVFLKLGGRRVVVVGGGSVALAKVLALRRTGAAVTVVAPELDPRLKACGVPLVERPFRPADLRGAWLVVAAAPRAVNRAVRAAADRARVFVNVVDDTEEASAFLGGVVRRGGLTLAVSTDGLAPALAGLVREALEALLPDDIHNWMETSAVERARWKEAGVPHSRRRPLLLKALNRIYAEGRRVGP